MMKNIISHLLSRPACILPVSRLKGSVSQVKTQKDRSGKEKETEKLVLAETLTSLTHSNPAVRLILLTQHPGSPKGARSISFRPSPSADVTPGENQLPFSVSCSCGASRAIDNQLR
jgi:hypothetical protein